MAVFLLARTYFWFDGVPLWPIDLSYRADQLANAITGGFVLFFALALYQIFSELRNQVISVQYERDEKERVEEDLRDAVRNLEISNEELEARVSQRSEQLRRELSEQIYAEKSLKESEERLLDLVTSSSDGIWEADANFKIGFLSGEYSNFVHSDEKSEFRKCLTQSLEKSLAELTSNDGNEFPAIKDEVIELNCCGKHAVYMRLSGKPVSDEAGKLIGYRGTVTDITEAKIATKINDELVNALEKINTGLAMWDAENRLVAYNGKFQRLMGIAEENFTENLQFEDFMQMRADVKKGINKDFDSDDWLAQHQHFHNVDFSTYEYQSDDGAWMLTTKQRLKDGGAIALHSDITELKSQQSKLEIARQDAEKANQAKSEFLSSMSHELRTPLNGILGFGQLLSYDKKHPLTESQAENVGHILSCGEHLLALINEVLDLAKIEAGKISLSLEPISVTSIIGECLEMTETVLEKYEVKLDEIPLGLNLPHIIADFSRILLLISPGCGRF